MTKRWPNVLVLIGGQRAYAFKNTSPDAIAGDEAVFGSLVVLDFLQMRQVKASQLCIESG
jgi:hypothetical protein